MTVKQGRATRFGLYFATATLLTAVVWPRPNREAGPLDGGAPEPPRPFSLTDWRTGVGSLADTLAEYTRDGKPAIAAAPSPPCEASLFAPADGGLGASPLAGYAPPGGWPHQSAELETAPPDAAALLGPDADDFMRALTAYKSNDFAGGDAAAAQIKDRLPATAALYVGLRLHPREAGFARLSRFLSDHQGWPAADWLRRRAEEQLYAEHRGDAAAKAFFADARPLTGVGKLSLARALAHDGDFAGAGELVRDAWREDDLGDGLETLVKKDFLDFLTLADHKYRADRLMYADKNAAALRAAELAGKDVVLLARARMGAMYGGVLDKFAGPLPQALQNDPGLLYARVHALRTKDKFAEAGALLRNAPREPEKVIDGDAWWKERGPVARKLLDRGDAATAYVVCAQHAARTANNKVEAEFLAGWIALRFLNDPAKAERHFALLAEAAETPIQKSRALYWQGRAAETLRSSDDMQARGFYANAAAHSTTFYGQLARAKIGGDDYPLRTAPTPAAGEGRDESVRAVELLFAAGEKEIGMQLAVDAVKHLGGAEQIAALGRVAAQRRDAKVALTLGKLAAHRGVALDDIAFPAYGVPQFATLKGSATRSVVYAIARQESAFDPKAVSTAGAMGLMQMIASTARRTASMAGVSFDMSRMLSEPAFNAQLGAAHLGILQHEYRGSYLLTFAAYNAGGGRVGEWVRAYGDPRHDNVDPIDWVERIPITETRNYVQRVMENFVVYRAKFGEQNTKAPQVELAHAGGAL
jgi:soluble lytic murein transglycosylase